MSTRLIKASVLAAGLMFAGLALAETEPSMHDVYQAAQAGRLDQAEQMMGFVLQHHPDSAKAHYVDAEILAREGKLDQARSELATARQYNATLAFASPASVRELESQLNAGHAAPNPQIQPVRQGSHFPWGLFVMGIIAIFGVFWLMRMFGARSRVIPAGPGPYYSGYQGGAYPPPGGYPGNPYGGAPMMPGGGGVMPAAGGGSGIVSNLMTGAAVGAGMVAGEEIAHHLMDGGRASAGELSQGNGAWEAPVNNDMGGNDFGITNDSSWDDGGDFGGGGDWT